MDFRSEQYPYQKLQKGSDTRTWEKEHNGTLADNFALRDPKVLSSAKKTLSLQKIEDCMDLFAKLRKEITEERSHQFGTNEAPKIKKGGWHMMVLGIAGSADTKTLKAGGATRRACSRDLDDNLIGVNTDVKEFSKWVNTEGDDLPGKQSGCWTQEMRWSGADTRKSEVVALVEKTLTKNMAFIMYAGHGSSKEGAWCFQAGKIGGGTDYFTFEEMMSKWKASGRCKVLKIFIRCMPFGSLGGESQTTQ